MIKDFSTVYWGYLPPTKEPYRAHKKVNAFIGPSGHGKTTIWDGLRLMLGASHFESKRTFSYYVQKSNWAVVRVAFYNFPDNGIQPFESIRKFKDEVTACCRIYKNDQGSWARDYYIFDGEFYDLADLQVNTKAYSEVSMNLTQYLQALEQCLGITKEFRNLMAMTPDTVREVVNSTPRTLFQLIFDLKGTKNYKKRYDESKQRLSAQMVTIERAEQEMQQAQSRFEDTKQKAHKFRLYQDKAKESEETKIKLRKLEYFEAQETLKWTKEEMIRIEGQGKLESDKVNKLEIEIIAKQKEIDELIMEYQEYENIEEQVNQAIINLTRNKTVNDVEIEKLERHINDLKQIKPQNIDDLVQLKDLLVSELDQKKLACSQAKATLDQLRHKLSGLEKNLQSYREDVVKFRKILNENQIPFTMLADALSVKPEMKKWQEAIEAYIGNNRYRIIVDSDNYLSAKKLQQMARYSSRLSLPKNGKVTQPRNNVNYPSIRSAINITHQEKVEGYLVHLNNVYLVDTVEEGHELQAKGIESITIEGLLQDDDGAIYLKYHTLCCGKLAIEEEKKRTIELLNKQESILEEYETIINKNQHDLDEVNVAISNQESLVKLPNMEASYGQLIAQSKELSEFIGIEEKKKDKVKKQKDDNYNKGLSSTETRGKLIENKSQVEKNLENFSIRFTELQSKMNSLTADVEHTLTEVRALGLSDDDIEFISYDIQGNAFKNQEGNLFSSKEIQNKLNLLLQEKEKLYDPSVSNEIVRVVEAQEGQVELLIQNLRRLKEDRDELEQTCDNLLLQFRGHIKDIMKDYISEFETLADLLKASAKGKLVEITPEPETWEIHLFIGYDGKDPVAVDGPDLSSGQKASTSLMILLAALSDNKKGKTAPIMFLDEPKARVDDDRGNEIGQLLQVTDIQYFITHQQGESLKTIDWIDHAFTCSACEPGKKFANPLIVKKRAIKLL